jgi:aflatoxin B1 aldehyde reductase
MSPKTNLDIIFGAMTFGKEGTYFPLFHPKPTQQQQSKTITLPIPIPSKTHKTLHNHFPPHLTTTPGKEGVRTSNLSDCATLLTTFLSHGHTSIDTSRIYGDGTSEEYLGALNWQSINLTMHTKFVPIVMAYPGREPTHSTRPHIRAGISESLTALKAEDTGVDLWYLHLPDRTVPLTETLAAVNELYQEGKFKRWGISNYMAWEVAQICAICDKEGYPRPSVYQGLYNALHRTVENELLPCLRAHGIAFYAFNPLAGGYLTGRYGRETKSEEMEAGSRFDEKRWQGRAYRMRYWNEGFFDALEILRPVVKAQGIRESEAALRWIMWHGKLKREFGGKLLLAFSSNKMFADVLNR